MQEQYNLSFVHLSQVPLYNVVYTVCYSLLLCSGEMRIRVHTLCVAVSSQPAHVYAGLNVQAITGVLAMMGKLTRIWDKDEKVKKSLSPTYKRDQIDD